MHRLPLTTAILIATAAATGAAHAQASGDGFKGPAVFGDLALDQSLAAMNRELHISYARKDAIEDLVVPATPDFADVAVAVLDQPEPADLETAPAATPQYFTEVSGDRSLETALAEVRSLQSDRADQLFLDVVRAASGDLQDQFDDGLTPINEFGPAITGDTTLTAKMVHVMDLIAPAPADDMPIPLPVRAFDDRSLDAWGDALERAPTDL